MGVLLFENNVYSDSMVANVEAIRQLKLNFSHTPHIVQT